MNLRYSAEPSLPRWIDVSRRLRVILAGLALALAACPLSAGPALSADRKVALAWDRNPEPDIASYTIHYGSESGVYTTDLDAGDETTLRVTGLLPDTTYFFVVTARNNAGLESLPSNEVEHRTSPVAVVLSRYVFYNNSAFDNETRDLSDDDAIATDKTALRAGGAATFANYTSYSRGLNGIMIDIADLPATPAVSDFAFKTGNDDDPAGWSDAPVPRTVSLRSGGGVDGSDRLVLVWNDNNLDDVLDPNEAVAKAWLEVTVLATANTGLAADEIFYFGNAIGDTGNDSENARVSTADVLAIRAHPKTLLDPASLTDPYDLNRDRKVSAQDRLIARSNKTTFRNELLLIDPGGVSLQATGPLSAPETPAPPESAGLLGEGIGHRTFSIAPGPMPSLRFAGLTGRAYRVYVCEDLGRRDWRPLSDAVREVESGQFEVVDRSPPSAHRFYLILPEARSFPASEKISESKFDDATNAPRNRPTL